jgi:hypothetical protein
VSAEFVEADLKIFEVELTLTVLIDRSIAQRNMNQLRNDIWAATGFVAQKWVPENLLGRSKLLLWCFR